MPLDRSNAHSQENGNSGRLKLVLRLDKSKSADAAEKEAPATTDSARPKRTPTNKTSTADEYTHLSADKKIPKKHEDAVDHDEHRPSRKRKSTMDSNFVFYSKKNEDGEEEEEEEEIEQKKPKKKSHRKDASAEGWADDSIPTPPLTEHDHHSGFKLKLKLPKPVIPDTPDQSKSKKPEVSSEGKKKKRGEEFEETEPTTPRTGSGVKLKIKSGSIEKKAESGAVLKKPKPEPGVTTKRHSPPRREESSVEKRETKIETHHERPHRTPKPTPEPKSVAPLDEDSVKMRKHLSGILSQLVKLDRQLYFTEPVTEDIAPQYFSIIAHPMDFKTMRNKLKAGKYKSIDDLQADFQLICNNCMTYNPSTTTYYREAKRMLTVGNRIIEKFLDGTATTTTTEHKQETKKEPEKTPTRQATPSTTPNKSFPSKQSTPTSHHHPSTPTPNRATPATPPNNNFGVAFPISSGQLSSMQHPISTTPQHQPAYPATPPMRKPAAYPTPLTPPYSQRLPIGQNNSNLPPPMRPPPTMPLQKSVSTNSIFPQRPQMGPPAPPSGANAPPRPQGPVGKPGSRPPVVSMGENQATQTQAMYPEQPKRKYVKPAEEPPKPAPPIPVAKTPAKLVAKIGNTPLVSPANVNGSFVYSMYIPRFEPGTTNNKENNKENNKTTTETPASPSTTTTTPTSPLITSSSSSSSTSASSPSSSSSTSSTTTTTTTTTTSASPSPLPPPTIKTPSGNLAINFASVNYVNNYVSVPSLYSPLPVPSAQDADDAWLRAPAKRVSENVELMEEIAQDCLEAMDSDSRAQMLGFFTNLAQQTQNRTQPLAFPKFATQAILPRAALTQTQPIKPIQKQQNKPPTSPTPTTPTPQPTPSITGNPLLDAELADQMSKLESLELTPQDLKQLQGLQLDMDLLSSLLPSSPLPLPPTPPTQSDASSSSSSSLLPPNSPPTETTTSTTTTTTTTTTTVSSPPTSPPTSPPVSSSSSTSTSSLAPATLPPSTTDKAKASKVVQEILDKNLEYLWSLQLMQHERVSGTPSEGELKLASQICDGLFVLGNSIPPAMLTTKEAVKTAIDQSGLVTGKQRHMRV